MKTFTKVILPGLLLSLAILIGCTQLEKSARDSLAAGYGAITQSQTEYKTQCQTDATQTPCVVINKLVGAENTANTALQAYCGFTPASPPEEKCQPVKTAAAALQVAVSNLNQAITDVKQVLK